MRVVLDTNIIVSSLITENSIPSKLLDMALSAKFDLCVSEDLISEYEEVLSRPKFNLDSRTVEVIITLIRVRSKMFFSNPQPLESTDPKDQCILDLAVTADAYLVTGNIKHFMSYPKAIKPSDFWELLKTFPL